MIAFLVRRLLQAIAVMAVVALCAFFMFQYVGDPINQMVAEDATAEDREYHRESLGLTDPIPLQFAKFALNAAQGNYGISYQHKRPVATLILERLPATLELALTAALIAALLPVLPPPVPKAAIEAVPVTVNALKGVISYILSFDLFIDEATLFRLDFMGKSSIDLIINDSYVKI